MARLIRSRDLEIQDKVFIQFLFRYGQEKLVIFFIKIQESLDLFSIFDQAIKLIVFLLVILGHHGSRQQQNDE